MRKVCTIKPREQTPRAFLELHGFRCSDSGMTGVWAMRHTITAPLSLDLRRRIVRAVESGASARQAAERFEVSPSAAIKLMRRVRQTGSPAPGQVGGHRRPKLEPHADLIRALVARKPRITLAELQAALAERGIEVKALSTISLMLHRHGLSHKKTR